MQAENSLCPDKAMRQVAIVGNGAISGDQARLIDTCDMVIRFNEWRNHGTGCGTRVDVLCISNTGKPAQEFIREKRIQNAPFIAQVSEIWFPRHDQTHLEHARRAARFYSKSKLTDLSAELVRSNQLSGKRIVHFSPEFNQRVFQELRNLTNQPFICPSTGTMAISYVLTEPRFATCQKHIFGFGFRGWESHPWEAERKWVQQLCAGRPDVHFWEPHV